MDNLQHWYVPNDRKAITSERMVSEIVMMNKLKIRAELKYLKSGAMCWMVYLPADDICKDVWCIALIYNKDFSMPGCKEPFVAMMAKPKPEELIAAIEKCGKMESNLVISVNPEGKSDMTCVEAVENLIKWRKTIYPLLDFTPNDELVQEEEPAQKFATKVTEKVLAEPETKTMKAENLKGTQPATESEFVGNFVQDKKPVPEEEQRTGRSVDEIQQNKQVLINQSGVNNVITGSGDQSIKVDSDAVNLDAPNDIPITESPNEAEAKRYSMAPETSNDENDSGFVALDYLDESGNFVADVPSFE